MKLVGIEAKKSLNPLGVWLIRHVSVRSFETSCICKVGTTKSDQGGPILVTWDTDADFRAKCLVIASPTESDRVDLLRRAVILRALAIGVVEIYFNGTGVKLYEGVGVVVSATGGALQTASTPLALAGVAMQPARRWQ